MPPRVLSQKILPIPRPRRTTTMRLRAIKSQRQVLERLRAEGTIGDEAYHQLEEEIAWAELDAAPAGRFQPLMT
jgi:monovalent cation/hydrogen antiporter